MPLTPKQKRFCDEYLIDLNATQAAIRAGYSSKTAAEQASRLLTNVNIQTYIQEKRQQLQQKTNITQERVLEEYAKLAFFDIGNAFDEDGRLKPLHEMDDATRHAIAGLESFDEVEQAGEETFKSGTVRKIKVWDKRAALDSICKVLGFNAPEKKQIDANVNNVNPPTVTLPDGTKLVL